ncbi:MAG: hypothetical protein ACRD8W_10930 [Nitrososphaeraceae archaeon]
MPDNIIYVKVIHKVCAFVQTGRHWFDVTDCEIDETTGLVLKAKHISAHHVADLILTFGIFDRKSNLIETRRRASKISQFNSKRREFIHN